MGFEEAAVDAMSQRRYLPTIRVKDGEPVEVVFTVDVNFGLQQKFNLD